MPQANERPKDGMAADQTTSFVPAFGAPPVAPASAGGGMGAADPLGQQLADESGHGTTEPGSPGFDAMLARMAVDKGLCTQEEMEACLSRVHSFITGQRKPLGPVLLRMKAVTPAQLDRLNAQVQADRLRKRIPGYALIEKIGSGASAAVFKARQLNLDRLVAIKVLPAKMFTNQEVVEKFYAEGRAAASLNHPNIVQAYDVGQAGEHHYFVMEYVQGPTVYDLVEPTRGKGLEEERALEIVLGVAEALRHAHERGLVHRDVKPKNIIVTADGVPKLADLGLARVITDWATAHAEQGRALGTPYFMSPEQVRGDFEIGPPSDIYSLGATFYYMVTGRPPFDDSDGRVVMQMHLKNTLVPACRVNPALEPGLSEVIDKMMAKEPRRRYQTCDDLLVDLRAWRATFILRRGERKGRPA
ncbi:MAG: serine/threonine protein kinase [Phycisphaerales bacterium]|nr:serine/threonine protein kinase [Phycisphaerales bacterium]